MIIIVVCIIRALSGIPAYIYPRKFISVLVLPSQTQLENLISCFNQNTHPTVEENRSSRWSAWFYPWRPPHQRWIPGSCCMASGASCTPLQWFFWFFTLKHFFWPIDEVVLHECDLLQRKFKSQDTGDHCLEFRSVGQLFWKYITTLFLEGAATTSLNWNYCYPHMIFPLLFWASKIFLHMYFPVVRTL